MKLQLLYIFVLAAPLLARLLSPGSSTQPTATEAAEVAPAKSEAVEPSSPKNESAPDAAPAKEPAETTKRSSLHRVFTAPTYASL
jgi:hypothetical protein